MQFIVLMLMLCSAQVIISAPITSGKAFFQIQNIDALIGQPDSTYYPPLAAPNRVSVTTTVQNPNAPVPPYRLHSWLGGAILWATGKKEEAVTDGYFVARNVPQTNTWPSEVFQQAPMIADLLILEYLEAPNQANSDPTTRGINLCFPFPYFYDQNTPLGF